MKDENINKEIGAILKKHRLSYGYTQEYVSELTGLAPKYISQIERGLSSGTISTLVKFCNVYKISTDAVLYPLLDEDIIKSSDEYKTDFKKLCERDQNAVKLLIEYYLKH